MNDPAELQMRLWESGSTLNGVFGLKHSFYEPHFSHLLETFGRFPGCPANERNRARIWEHALPNHHHIFMTRRNKVRLAVSWWKAIKTQEWHRLPGESPKSVDLTAAYSFDAIHHLYRECSMREAGIQEFFSEGNIVPLTIVYEDFIYEYEKTVRNLLAFLGLDSSTKLTPPSLAPTADAVSEEWVQRFREELQAGKTEVGSEGRLISIFDCCILTYVAALSENSGHVILRKPCAECCAIEASPRQRISEIAVET